MKLFLASAFNQVASQFEQKMKNVLKGKKVIFIANPADTYKGDKWWVKIDRDVFEKLGYEIFDCDLRSISMEEFSQRLIESDVIHVCGGSVFYTISLMREKGFDKPIKEFVRDDKIVYSGTSAGSMIVSTDLSLDKLDLEEKEFVAKIDDFSGLGLVKFLIMPHANNKDFTDGDAELVRHLPEYSQPLIFLYDHQAVWVGNDKFEIVSV